MKKTGKCVLLSGGFNFDCSIFSDYTNIQSNSYNRPVHIFISIQDTDKWAMLSKKCNLQEQNGWHANKHQPDTVLCNCIWQDL